MELNNLEILEIIKKHRNKSLFLGVFPRNLIPLDITYPSAMIINTDPSYKKGQHWLAIYYNKNKEVEFFDSYGYPPSFYNLDDYLKKTSKSFTFNKKKFQSFNSKLCGFYVCLFILFKLNNIPMKLLQKINLNDEKFKYLLNK